MKKLLIITALALLLPAAGLCWTTSDAMRAVVAAKNDGGGEVPSGITITNLTHDQTTSSNPTTTASLTPSAGSMLIVSIASATDLSVDGSHSVSGCGLTWTEVKKQVYGYRRLLSAFIGTGTVSSGALTITFTPGAGRVFQETMYSVEQVTGYNTSDPDDAAVSSYSTNNLELSDVGSPDEGDMIFSTFAHESGTNNFAFTTGITELAREAEGANTRQIITGYELDSSMDETPGVTSDGGGNTIGGIAFIINVGS